MQSFRNKKVLIMGLGLQGGGASAAKFFYKQGANVLVTDLKTKEQLAESLNKLAKFKIKYTLGKHEEKDFLDADLIIKNPDVPSTSPYLQIAKAHKIPIETDVSLFFKLSKTYIIGITGTKGKSTTASLIHHFLKIKYKTFLAGNIGVSPLELLPKVKKGDKVVLELSSFELEDLNQGPNIAVITNIMPEHLTRHGSMENYIEAKERIFKFQTKKDHLVLNADDFIVRQMAKRARAEVCWFYPQKVDATGFKLSGAHNKANLAAAIEVAKILKIPEKLIEKSLKTFKNLANRQELVGEYRGVKYFNDTTATMPEAVIAAIETFSEKYPKSNLIFISGGVSKGGEYSSLAAKIKEKAAHLIMLPGSASDEIKQGLQNYKNLYLIKNMQEAVMTARKLAKPGDVVALSPGGSSFNLFKNEFDRGNQFIKSVKELNEKKL